MYYRLLLLALLLPFVAGLALLPLVLSMFFGL
jgi:hypothetical protein